nr:hypothetical protein [Luteibacter rhizovicinus]
MKRFPLAAAFWTMCGTAAAEGAPQEAIELYVDTTTRQLFAEPGPGRQRLGKFAQGPRAEVLDQHGAEERSDPAARIQSALDHREVAMADHDARTF